MSYLLTEIALEMLGYKFHDIDGVCKRMNFRKADAEDIIPEDKLETILGMDQEEETTKASNVPTDSSNINDTIKSESKSKGAPSNSKDSLPQKIRVAAFATKQLPKPNPSPVNNNTSQSIPFLASILNYEAGRVKQRLKNRQGTENDSTDEHQLLLGGIEILKEELKQIKAFRCHAEQELKVLNPNIYEGYNLCFSQKEVETTNTASPSNKV